ncbi:Hypothetical predicted protein, partial [Mytilus galloprovincialis]
CERGDIETVQILIRNMANVNMKTDSGEMPLVAACQQGHGILIKVLLDAKADINQALYCAVQKDYDRAVKILLYKGGDLGYKDVDGKSLLALACENGSMKAIKILFEKGANFEEIDVNGKTLLHFVCNTYSVDLLQLLTDKGLCINMPDEDGRFPLFASLDKGIYDLSEFFIQKGCAIAISEEDTTAALLSVFESGNKKLSKLLVAYGYAETLLNLNEDMLYNAYRLGLFEQVKVLLRNNTDIKTKYKNGYTPMILADIGGNDDLSEYLHYHTLSDANERRGLVYTSDIELVTEDYERFQNKSIWHGQVPETEQHWRLGIYEGIFRACMYGEETRAIDRAICLKKRFNFFFNPSIYHVSIWFKQTPLCLASRRGHKEIVEFLLSHRANVNLTFEDWAFENVDIVSTTIQYGYTPLFAACQREYNEITDMLLEYGANKNKALYDACHEGYIDTVKFLLQKGATALYSACIGGYYTIVKFLIEQGAVIDEKVEAANITDEVTCIHAAYKYGNIHIVQLLIDRGASVDTIGNFGLTLLHRACKEGHCNIVKILIDEGVDINASDMYGATPLLACVLQNEEHIPREIDFPNRMIRAYRSLEDHYVYQMHKDYVDERIKTETSRLEGKILTDNHYKVVQLLLENGVDINKADRKGRTPLSIAKQTGDIQLVDLLLLKERLLIQ